MSLLSITESLTDLQGYLTKISGLLLIELNLGGDILPELSVITLLYTL